MSDLNPFPPLSTFEVSHLSNQDATGQWDQFHNDLSQTGCMVTVLGRQGDALEFRFHAPDLDFQVAAGFTLRCLAEKFPEHKPEMVLVSGCCFEPGCADFGQRVSCCLAFRPVQ